MFASKWISIADKANWKMEKLNAGEQSRVRGKDIGDDEKPEDRSDKRYRLNGGKNFETERGKNDNDN